VLRLLTGVLFLMLGTMLVRYVVWGAVWLLTGSHFWILPNLMSETVSEISHTSLEEIQCRHWETAWLLTWSQSGYCQS
jgi:hypothetical protein